MYSVCVCLSVCQNSNLQEPSMHPGPRQMNPETLDFSNENDLSNVNVKSLVSELAAPKPNAAESSLFALLHGETNFQASEQTGCNLSPWIAHAIAIR